MAAPRSRSSFTRHSAGGGFTQGHKQPSTSLAFKTTPTTQNAGFASPAAKKAKLVLTNKAAGNVSVSDIFAADEGDDEEEEAQAEDTRSTFQKNSNLERFKKELQKSQEH